MIRSTRQPSKRLAWIVAALMVASSCSGGSDDTASTTTARPDNIEPGGSGSSASTGGPSRSEGGLAADALGGRLGIQLSEGSAELAAPVSLVSGTPLGDDEVASILGRLPEWDVPDDDQVDFNRPADSLKPPIVGDTVDVAFPPDAPGGARTEVPAGPLEVLRFQPEGDLALAPFLSVTFNQPMVAITTLEQLDAKDVPAVLTPDVPGRWRWIGTRTLRFEVEPGATDRLPMATNFRVEIPAGTRSATGNELAEAVAWEFATPAPSVQRVVPLGESLALTPVFVAVFDQIVDPSAVLATTTLTANGQQQRVTLATTAEIDGDDVARQASQAALEGRWVAFRADAALPADSDLSIEIGPGTPSLEGPLTTTDPEKFNARTFAPLRVRDKNCDCVPGGTWWIEFNNPLDLAAFDASMLTFDPELPGRNVSASGGNIQISGVSTGRTRYTVTLAAGLADVYGQTLGEDVEVTFDIGAARPFLEGFNQELITLDPVAERRGVSVTSVNNDGIRVTAWAVTPDQYGAYRKYVERLWSDTDPQLPDWPQVLSTEIEIDADEDQITETFIDLDVPLTAAGDQLVVRVETRKSYPNDSEDYWQNRPTVAWVQSTGIGVDAFVTGSEVLAWTTDLTTGQPLPGVVIEPLGPVAAVTTDADGLATIPLSSNVLGLVATLSDDTALLPSSWSEGWQEAAPADEARWFVFDDRGIYKPGETVRFTGWVRKFTTSTDRQLALIAGQSVMVTYAAYDAVGNDVGTGQVDVNALGGFNLSFDLPEGSNLGEGWIDLSLSGQNDVAYSNSGYGFTIQEFRTPEFEVTARHESPEPYYASDPAVVAVDAAYYSGGPLPDAEVDWTVTSRTTTYTPPNRDDFTFGIWTPWWIEDFGYGRGLAGYAVESDVAYDSFDEGCFEICPPGPAEDVKTFTGRTDANGSHFLRMDFEAPEVDQPSTVSAAATVFDVNRQAWSSQTDVLVHPSHLYVGLRSDRAFVEQGTPLKIEAIVTDIDGAAVAAADIAMTAGRLEWQYVDGQWSEQLVDEQECSVVSDVDVVSCTFDTEIGGTYEITAIVADDEGLMQRSQLTRWVSGGEGRPTRNVEQESVTIVPDRETYVPGDTAELLVQAPFSPAHGLMTVLRGGIESTEVFDAPDGTAVLNVPLADDDIPNVTVQIDMVGSAERSADDGTPLPDVPPRPAFAVGSVNLSIPPASRTLAVSATPDSDNLRPGDDTTVTIHVSDAAGADVAGADVAVVVVDEAVLSLTGYELTDPVDAFYGQIYSSVTAEYARRSIVLNRSDLIAAQSENGAYSTSDTAADDAGGGVATAEEGAAPTAGDASSQRTAAGDGASPQIDVRADFEALAVYAPAETTDANGNVTVDVALPDNLTRYRVMAVAVDGVDQFGKGESSLTARLPLMVRPSAPRFLNFGDTFDLPIVVQNQTDAPLDVDVAIEVANLTLTEGAGRRVTVPANDRVEVRFPAAADAAGTARFRVAVVRGESADAAEIDLPVYTPATAEAFAVYGVVDEGAIAQPLEAPTGVFPQFGGLEIGTSSTALQALTDAVLYLHEYRYPHADGVAARITAVAALRDVLEAFDATGLPSPDDLNQAVNRDLDALAALQNDDGGFPTWRRGERSEPFVTIEAAQALIAARDAGYDVSANSIEAALTYLAAIEQYFESWYSDDLRNTLSAFALNVRNRAGDRDTAKADELYGRAGADLQLDALAWLWPVLDDATTDAEIERTFQNRATETAGAATFATSYGEDAYVIANSDRRTDGIVLDALITERPDSDLIPKVVAGLLGGQVRGRWNNVHENSSILLAMKRYFDTFENVDPDFVARVWLGDLYAAEHEYAGRTTDRDLTVVPMSDVISEGNADIVLAKDGTGRLYYRLGLRYAPDDLQLAPRDEGFVVDRTYEAVDDPGDVARDVDGVWRIKAGATVRVRLTMVADAVRTNVALIDPLPAGLEPLNPALDVSIAPPPDDDPIARSSSWCWCWRWYEHENLRDDRAEAYASYVGGGTYEYTYTARATTPGTFVVPPARAEEMYSPEVFGRSGSTSVVVE